MLVKTTGTPRAAENRQTCRRKKVAAPRSSIDKTTRSSRRIDAPGALPSSHDWSMPRKPPPPSEAQHLYPERTIFQRAGDGVAVVASGGRPIIESAAAVTTLINTPDAKTHDAVNRPVSRHARNFVGAAYRADVSGGRNSHDTASQVITAGAITAKRPGSIAVALERSFQAASPGSQARATRKKHHIDILVLAAIATMRLATRDFSIAQIFANCLDWLAIQSAETVDTVSRANAWSTEGFAELIEFLEDHGDLRMDRVAERSRKIACGQPARYRHRAAE